VVLTGERAGTVLPLEGELVVGRGSEAGLRLKDVEVSSRHCRLHLDDSACTLTDLGSTNGTFCNGRVVEGTLQLQLGDVIQVGSTKLLYTTREEAPSRQASPVLGGLIDEEPTSPRVHVVGAEREEVLLGDSDPFGSDPLAAGIGQALVAVDAVQRAWSQASGLDDLVQRIASSFARATAAEHVFLSLRDESDQPRIVFHGEIGPGEGFLPTPSEVTPRMDLLALAHQRRGAFLAEASQDATRHGLGAARDLCLALPSSAGLLGAVYLHGARGLSREDLRLLLLLAGLAGAHLRTQQLLVRLQEQRRAQDHPPAGAPELDQVQSAIVTLSLEGQVLAWNEGAQELYGHQADEVVGELLPTVPDEHGSELEKVLEAVAAGRALTLRSERLTVDGRQLTIEATYAPIRNTAGEVRGAIEIARDLGPQLRVERQRSIEAQQASVHSLAATLAHELGNPLANLRGGVDWLLARPRSEAERRDSLATLRDEIDRLHRITQSALDLARFELPELEVLAVEELLTYAAAVVGPRAEELGVELRLPSTGSTTLRASSDQLKQALLNLVDNALAAMPEGGILELSCELDGDAVVILVSDTGAGIPSDQLERVFEPFFTTRSEGSGVGLATVRRIAQLHGGEAWLESGSEGSTACLRLPRGIA